MHPEIDMLCSIVVIVTYSFPAFSIFYVIVTVHVHSTINNNKVTVEVTQCFELGEMFVVVFFFFHEHYFKT